MQDKDICVYEFTYPLSRNGKDYAFQVKSIDRAGNLSIISEDEVVYFDNQNPRNPEVLRTASPSYNPTPGWVLGLRNSLTKDTSVDVTARAESLSDLEFNTSGPQNFKSYIFSKTPGNQVATQSLPLGNNPDEREGCVQTIDTRRTGVCQDGNYEVAIKSTDAAGNPSAITKHTVERDTVRPAQASLKVTKSGAIGNELLGVRISGERNATALITLVRDGKETRRLNVTLSDDGTYSTSNLTGMLICGATKYTVIVRIQDKAGNISPISTGSITTQDCPRCVYDGNSLALPVRPDYKKTSGFRTPSRPDHKAIDMVRVGDTYRAEIFAAGKGYVKSASHSGGSQWGKANYVSIKHDDGKTSYYWHLDNEVEQPITVNEGTDIDSVIGHMGNTGKSTATHLHFEVWVSGGAVNPEFYFTGKSNIDCSANASGVAGTSDEETLDFFRNIDLREELEDDDPNDLRLDELWDVLYEDGSKLRDMEFMERNIAYFEGAVNFCAGILECLWDNTLGGIWDTGSTIVDILRNFDEYKQQFDQIMRQIFSLKTLPMLIGIDIDDFIDSDYNTRMKYVGKAICEVGLFVFPYTTATKVLKVGKVGSIIDKVSDITKIGKFIKAADTVSDFLDITKIAKKIGVTVNDLLPVVIKLKKANDSLGVNSYGLGKSAEEVLESVGEIKLGKKITSSMTEAVGEFTMYDVLRKWKEQSGAMIDPKFQEFKKRHGPDLIVEMGEEMPEELMSLGGGKLMFIESKGSSTGVIPLSKLKPPGREVQGSEQYLKNRAKYFAECKSCSQDYTDYWSSIQKVLNDDNYISIGIFTDTKNNKVRIYDLKDGNDKVLLKESDLEDLTRIKE